MAPPNLQALRQIAAQLQRVLIVEPSTHSARLLADLLKELGARYIHVEAGDKGALAACKTLEPLMVFTELAGPMLDGLGFVKALRRSGLSCRKAPVIVVTDDATAMTIMASRDAGVHEFLRKPFTMNDLIRRVEAVTLKSRPWIEGVGYVGPDRRRFNSADFRGMRKRNADTAPMGPEGRIGQALKILRAAIDAVEADPAQALRSMQAQVDDLRGLALETGDAALSETIETFHRAVRLAISTGRRARADFEASALSLWGFAPAPEERSSKSAA